MFIDLPLLAIVLGNRHRHILGNIPALAASIADVGLLHPVVVDTQHRLIAGARRMAAFEHLGRETIPAYVVQDFAEALQYLRAERDENACREALTPTEVYSLSQALLSIEKPAAQDRMKAGKPSGKLPKGGRANERVAEAVGVGRRTLEKIAAVVEAAKAEPEKYAAVVEEMDKTGKVDRAHKAYRRKKMVEDRESQSLPPGKFSVFYADPPWHYGNSGMDDSYGHAERHYKTLTVEELCALPIKSLVTENAVLFLWVPSPILEDAFPVITAWGFAYKASFVWDKVRHNFGHYNSVRHEFLLVATRGSYLPEPKALDPSIVTIERSKTHSEKPAAFRTLIEKLYPHGTKLELFARQATIPGWALWGDQAG